MAVEEPPVSIINNARIDNQYRQNCNSILWRGWFILSGGGGEVLAGVVDTGGGGNTRI